MKHSNCNLVIRLRELRDNTPQPFPACQLACLPKLMCASSLRRRLILFCFGFFFPPVMENLLLKMNHRTFLRRRFQPKTLLTPSSAISIPDII